MITSIIDKLQQHPSEVGDTYWEHFRLAFTFGCLLMVASCACIVHAILPFCCTSTGSSLVKKLHSSMVENRGSNSVRSEEDRELPGVHLGADIKGSSSL